MSDDIFQLKHEFVSANLVCDATPDPPIQSENSNSVYDRSNLSENQQQKNEQKSNIPLTSENENLASNSTSKRSDKSKSGDSKSSKWRRKSKPNISYVIVDSSNVKIGATTVHTYNFNNYQNFQRKECNDSKDKEEIRQMLPHIQVLSESKEVLTKDDMLLIKTHLGSGWKNVAKLIGFSKGELDQFIEDHSHNGIGEVIYKLLVAWKNSRTKDANIGYLVCAMWSSQEYECVERLAIAHKTEA